jgi:hypothetical protein
MLSRTVDPAWRPPPPGAARPRHRPDAPRAVPGDGRPPRQRRHLHAGAAPPPGHQVVPFRPGQFNMLYVFGVGEVPISISGDPDRPETLVHTTREVGAVTRAMRALRVGDAIGVRGPVRHLLAGGRRRGPRRRADRRRHRPAAAAPGALPRARPARALRPGDAAVRRPDPEDMMFPARAGRVALPLRPRGAHHRRPRHGYLARQRRRGHPDRQAGADRPAPHGGDDLRTRDHDPLRLRGARPPRRQPAGHLRLARTQHEVRRRPVRALPSWAPTWCAATARCSPTTRSSGCSTTGRCDVDDPATAPRPARPSSVRRRGRRWRCGSSPPATAAS